MHILNKSTLLVIMVVVLITGQTQPSFAQKIDGDSAIENAILVHINQYRQQKGLSKLKMNSVMVKEARQHSLDMAQHRIPFGHKYFNDRIKRIYAQTEHPQAGAENVAYNYKDAKDVVNNWLRSPGHKRNIDGQYNETGIGVVRDQKGKMYFTQMFLRTGTNSPYIKRTIIPGFLKLSYSR